MEVFNAKAIMVLDSLFDLNLLSKHVYEFNKKRIQYVLNNNKRQIKQFLKNDDIHIDTYRGMILNFVNSQINPRIIENSNGHVFNYISGFDFIANNDFFQSKTRDFLLWHYLKGIAENFAFDDLKIRYDQFVKLIHDKNVIDDFNNKYLIEYAEFNSRNDEVFLLSRNKKRTSLSKVIKENKGKVIYLDFWASWCEPCRKVMPDSKNLIRKYEKKSAIFIYVSIDKNIDDWTKASKKEELSFYKHSYLAINFPKALFFDKLKLKEIPRYLVYDKKGKLVHQNAPGPKGPEIRELLDRYLAE